MTEAEKLFARLKRLEEKLLSLNEKRIILKSSAGAKGLCTERNNKGKVNVKVDFTDSVNAYINLENKMIPELKFEIEKIKNKIKEHLEKIDEREAVILEKRYLENKNFKTIAEEENLSLSSVYRIKEKAMDNLSRQLHLTKGKK